LFGIYIDSLLHLFAESDVGCFIGRLFVGALVYTDDIALPSPTASGMRTLLHLCDGLLMIVSVVFSSASTSGRPGGTPAPPSYKILAPTKTHETILVTLHGKRGKVRDCTVVRENKKSVGEVGRN